jgi:hypothetical protein
VLILTIKQAEKALADGRLEETFDLLLCPGVRKHCRGQALAGRLAQAFLARAQNHLNEGHLPQALSDCKRAAHFDGQSPEVTALRQAVCDAMDRKLETDQQCQARLACAEKQIVRGRLSVGESLLQEMDAEYAGAARLGQEVHMQRVEVEHIRQELERALSQDDLELALATLTRSWDTLATVNGRCEALVREIKDRALRQLRQDLAQGHVRRVQATLGRLQPVIQAGDPLDDFTLAVSICAEAKQAIESGRLSEGTRLLQKAKTLLPDMPWLTDAIAQIQSAAAHVEQVGTGPLSLLDPPESCGKVAPLSEKAPQMSPPRSRPAPRVERNRVKTENWLLQVDGVGSFLLYTAPSLTVGPISSSARPTLGLMTDPSLPTVTITRDEEDYFMTSDRAVRLDRVPVQRSLLTDGQRIHLSDRCRIKFNRPNAASTTATLCVTGARFPRNDIRYAMMMDDCLLIGPGSHHHVRAMDMHDPVTLTYRNGQFYGQARQCVRAGDRSLPAGSALPLNKTVTIGEVSLTLTQAD